MSAGGMARPPRRHGGADAEEDRLLALLVHSVGDDATFALALPSAP